MATPKPKKTGKRGIGPKEEALKSKALDPGEDFDKPVKVEEQAQGELVEMPSEPQPVVVKGRILAQFIEPIFTKAPKSGDRLIAFDMSVMLTKDHDEGDVIPRAVKNAWRWLSKDSRTRANFEVPGQVVKFYLAHDAKEEELVLPAAKVINSNCSVVQTKGEGKALKQIRWKFQYQVSWNKEVERFAASNYGNAYWITTKNTDEPLFDEEDEDATDE